MLTALAVALPVPLLAALGLSLPLPGSVERLAAKLVPFADDSAALTVPARGSIVLAPAERRAGTTAVAASGELASTQPGRVAHAHEARATTAPAGGAAPATVPGDEVRTSTTAVPDTGSSTPSSTAPTGSGGETAPGPVPAQPDSTPTPTPTTTPTPTPTSAPTPTPTGVVDTATATANNAVSTVSNTVTTATDTAKKTADDLTGNLPHLP